MRQRTLWVCSMLQTATSPREIIYQLEGMGVSKNAAMLYIREARKILREEYREKIHTLVEETQASLDLIIARSFGNADHRVALEAIRERAKLAGIYSPEKIQAEVRIVSVPEDSDI